jgi:hypothetical protein
VSRYDLHGVAVETRVGDPALAEALDGRLRHFRAEATREPDVVFELGSEPQPRPSGTGRRVYEPPEGEVLYFDGEDVLWIDFRGVRVRCEPARGRVWSWGPSTDVWLRSRPMFTLPLVETLKRRGLYALHAAGVARDGRALLLPGTSGAGKSTLTVALARASNQVLADDMVFIAGDRVHGFPDEADVSDATARWFPELAALDGRTPEGWPKHRVRLEDVFGVPVAMTATPAAIVLPEIADVEVSTLEPVPAEVALVALAPNVLLTEPAAAQQHLDALGELVRRTPCQRLVAGRDFDHIAALLGAAIEVD